jgi:hypothetical protein
VPHGFQNAVAESRSFGAFVCLFVRSAARLCVRTEKENLTALAGSAGWLVWALDGPCHAGTMPTGSPLLRLFG